jgi:5'-phosphate synthase pdxT subunit
LPRIGILAIQGDVLEHRRTLDRLGIEVSEIRLPHQLDDVDGIIIPGGESTTIVQLIDIYGFRDKFREKAESGFPIYGTCAGMIVIAKELTDHRPDPLKLMNIQVSRNAFGRQIDSFETDIDIEGVEGGSFRCVFIRAPVVNAVGEGVDVIARMPDGRPVAVRQGSMLATSFHPELTEDGRVHRYFAEIVEDACGRGAQPSPAAGSR